MYPEILDKLVVVNAPMAKLWSKNVFYYPQLFMVRGHDGLVTCAMAGRLIAWRGSMCSGA